MRTTGSVQIKAYWLLVIPVLVVSAGWFGFISSYNNKLENAIRYEQELKVLFQRKQRVFANRDAYELQIAEIKHQLGLLDIRLPVRFDRERIVTELTEHAKKAGLILVSPTFGKEVPWEFYSELQFSLGLVGPFESLYSYLYHNFYNSNRGVRLSKIHLRPTGKGNELRLKISGKHYRFIEEGSQ